jgi:hypothetical protein
MNTIPACIRSLAQNVTDSLDSAYARYCQSRKSRACSTVAIVIAVAALTPLSRATIIGGEITGGASGGTFVILTPPLANPFGSPNTVGNNNFQSKNLYAFNEAQNVLLTSPMSVDILTTGNAGLLPEGTVLASHYVFFDPVSGAVRGYVDFDSDIVGLVTSTASLAASDFITGTGVNYLTPAARGIETDDLVQISPISSNRLLLDLTTGTPGDYVRVLTARSSAVPDGGPSIALLAFSIAGVGMLRLRFRRRVM